MDWTGAASDGFKDATKKLPKELESAQTYFKAAANALDSYADKLRSVQKRVKPIIEDADDARAKSKSYWNKVTDYNAAVDRKDETLPERPPEDDPGLSALEGCYSRLDKLEGELKPVVDAAKRKIDKAAEKAPNKPPGPERNKVQGLPRWYGRHLGGWYEGFDDMVHDGPDGVGLRLAGTVDGAAYAAPTPRNSPRPPSTGTNGRRTPPAPPASSPPTSSWPWPPAAPDRTPRRRRGQERRPAPRRPRTRTAP